MTNGLTALDSPLGPQPASPDLYSHNSETIHLTDNIFRSVAYETVVRTTDGKHGITISKTPTSSSGPRFSVGSTSTGQLFTFLQLKSLIRKYTTDLAMDQGIQLSIRPKIWNPKADLSFCNAADGLQYQLEVDGDWGSDIIRILHGERPVATIKKHLSQETQVPEVHLTI